MHKNNELIKRINGSDKNKIIKFFNELENLSLSKNDIKKLCNDYETLIIYYLDNNYSIKKILNLLPLEIIKKGYSKNNNWYPLDNSSKVYPLSMGEEIMSIYRLSIYLNDDINPIVLQMALNYTIIRFPIFKTSIHKGLFWNYLDGINKHFKISQEKHIPCSSINISKDRNELFKVTYYKNRINCEFFHVLTDAYGGIVFLLTLTNEYLRLLNKKVGYNENVLKINEFDNGEIIDEFSNIKPKCKKGNLIEKKAIQIDGNSSIIKPCQIIHYDLDFNKLHQLAKNNDLTINELLLSFIFNVLSFSTSKDGYIKIQVPVNMRKYYPTKTLRNFSLYNVISIKKNDITSLDDVIPLVKKESREKLNKEALDRILYQAIDLVKKVSFVPLIIKKPITKFIYSHFADKSSTTTLSNLGNIVIPQEMMKEIKSLSFSLGANNTNKLLFSVITVNNIVTLTISKFTTNTSVENNLYNLLKEFNLIIKVYGSDKYEIRK